MFESVAVFVFGAILGSFFNVCIHRLPQDMSVSNPKFSFCPKCKETIKWYDNIPFISYILLRGKCRNCKEKIPFRYFLVELITASVTLWLYMQFAFSLDFFRFLFFFSMLIIVSFIDIDYHAIPVYLCFLGIVVGMGLSVYETVQVVKTGNIDNIPLFTAGKNLIFGLGFAYLFKLTGDVLLSLYLAWTKRESIEGETEALGLGDVDFMGMVGIFLGTKLMVVTFFVAPFIAVIYSVIAVIFKKSHLLPYLPYLSAASFISFIWGYDILRYLGF